MARQPRGRRGAGVAASPVPLIAFITLFVFTFIAFVMMYRENADLRDQIEGDAPASRGEFQVIREEGKPTKGYLFMLGQEREKLRKKTEDFNNMLAFLGFDQAASVEPYKKHVAEMRDRLGIKLGENEVVSVKLYTDRLEARALELQHALGQAKDDADGFNEKLKAALDERKTAVDGANKEISTLKDDRAKNEEKLANDIKDRDAEVAKLSEKITALDKKHLDDSEKANDDLASLKKSIAEKDARIAQLLEKAGEKFDPQTAEPDGKVLVVNLEDKTVMLDIGRRDGARKGLRFEVYETGVGGVRRLKGEVEIKRVHDEVSYAGITKMKDPLDPILTDNIVVSPAFQRGKPMIFTLEPADFDKADIEVLRTKLGEVGNKIVDEPAADVRYCIIGDSPAKGPRPIADQCTKLGIPTIRKSDLQQVLGEE